MEEIQKIVDYAITLLPTITAILSLIGSIIYIFRKTGNISKEIVDNINDMADGIRKDNAEVKEDNKKLRADLKALAIENEALRKQVGEVIKNTSKVRR